MGRPQIRIGPQAGFQEEFLRADCFELLGGGVAGAGKSWVLLLDFLQDVKEYGSDWNGMLIRKHLPDLNSLIRKGKELFRPFGAIYKEVKHQFVFPNGSTLDCCFMDDPRDWERHQGGEWSWIGWDEVCQQDTADNYIKMTARVRNHPRARIRATGQPGTLGASWVKDYFKIGQFPHGRKIIAREIINERTGEKVTLTRMFIPGKLAENKILLKRDPNYEIRLQNLPPALRKAWYEGSWDIFFGQRFSWFPQFHIMKNGPWPPPDTAQIFMSFDRGFGAPFSVGWWWTGKQGELYRAREWYGWNGTKNQGLRLPPSEIAEGIIARERRWGIWGKVSYRAAGREVFSGSVNEVSGIQGPSWNEIFIGVDPALSFTKVKDDRRKDGFSQIDERLKLSFDKDTGQLTKLPGLRIYEECEQFLRIFPDVVAARGDPEEIDCEEDHIIEDTVRACMSRPLAMQDRIPVKSEVEKLVEQIDSDSYYNDEKFSNYGEGEDFPY